LICFRRLSCDRHPEHGVLVQTPFRSELIRVHVEGASHPCHRHSRPSR
jgi:hypothetical protein